MWGSGTSTAFPSRGSRVTQMSPPFTLSLRNDPSGFPWENNGPAVWTKGGERSERGPQEIPQRFPASGVRLTDFPEQDCLGPGRGDPEQCHSSPASVSPAGACAQRGIPGSLFPGKSLSLSGPSAPRGGKDPSGRCIVGERRVGAQPGPALPAPPSPASSGVADLG